MLNATGWQADSPARNEAAVEGLTWHNQRRGNVKRLQGKQGVN
jgi:hypothetical protein